MPSSDKKKTADLAPAKPAVATTKSGAAAAPATSKTTKQDKPCTSFFVKVDVLTPDDQHEIHFGVSKTCNKDNTATWSLRFTLKELSNGQMKTRVDIEAQVGPENAAAMEKLAASKSLTEEQKDTLQGPVKDMVDTLAPGSAGTPEVKAAIVEAVTT